MIDFIRIDHIHICVPPERLVEARAFYTDIIGLQLIDRPNHLFSTIGFWFDIGNIQLHIGIEPSLAQSTRHSAFEVSDVAAALAHLQKNNIEIKAEPAIPGRTRFAFIDPFGNRMELLEVEK